MKKLFFIAAIAIFYCMNVNAQQFITRQNGSTVAFYTSLDSAINNAQNGDTLYLSGGSFALVNHISKRVHIIGVGHHPDSTAATNMTLITGEFFLLSGADAGSMSGVYLQGGIIFGNQSSNGHISNYTLNRCNINYLSSSSNAATNNLFYENVFRSQVNLANSQSNAFYNNILPAVSSFGPNTFFKNNIFLRLNNNLESYVNNSTFENNVFLGVSPVFNIIWNYYIENNIFNSNLFVENISFPYGANMGLDNIVNQPLSSIFVNQTGNEFNYTHDYHLQASSPGNNAGTDGTDIGIYGGVFPWKDGSLPNNPHIQFKNISGTTDQNGNLQINIKVKAQDN